MNFLQRIGNALSRFMYGRNGVDKLGLTMLWAAILLNLINMFLRESQPAAQIALACGQRDTASTTQTFTMPSAPSQT